MSGHSKWANIKHKKERSDAKRGKIFTKIGREIYVAVKQGGPDPEGNSKLKDIIAKAKAANMPNDNIARSIKKAAGAGENENYEEIIYEGYGPSGVAVIVEAMTDNRNRTASDVRHVFDKYGGNLGTTGCVSYMFDKKGIIIIERTEGVDEDTLIMAALEAGAEDVTSEEEFFEVVTSVNDFSAVREGMEKAGFEFLEAQFNMIPQTTVKLDEGSRISFEKIIDALEDNDDVQNIYHNWEE
ncbi:MAG TPA: YebC/PmpR family DNA-binding transcriptional regulator [Clostridia bacterium]|nr:YebC/PmpR family DNA-binding transcriptional regulator [Clostridia bacterium]HRX42878.1 YebC/PmpR family DNA-binding transcriptional regulator [Clostridia bacterium]